MGILLEAHAYSASWERDTATPTHLQHIFQQIIFRPEIRYVQLCTTRSMIMAVYPACVVCQWFCFLNGLSASTLVITRCGRLLPVPPYRSTIHAMLSSASYRDCAPRPTVATHFQNALIALSFWAYALMLFPNWAPCSRLSSNVPSGALSSVRSIVASSFRCAELSE